MLSFFRGIGRTRDTPLLRLERLCNAEDATFLRLESPNNWKVIQACLEVRRILE